MPPFTPNASKAQQRLMFAKADKGEVSMADAKGRARASKGKRLPEGKSSKGGSFRGGRR